MIDTSGTRYRFTSPAADLWVLENWRDDLNRLGLHTFDDFFSRTGLRVDFNRRSEVVCLELGDDRRRFFLKRHTNYLVRSWRRWPTAVPVIQLEVENIMRYARLGFDALEPAAWGWRAGSGGGQGFLLTPSLPDYVSLTDMFSDLETSSPGGRHRQQRLARSVAEMLAGVHRAGICHRDLFSWHVFVRRNGEKFNCQLIDLERSTTTPPLPLARRWQRRCQAGDLACLHLTVPYEQASHAARLRFLLHYLGRSRLDREGKSFLRLILQEARRKGRKAKFTPFGVSQRLRRPSA